MTRKSVYLLIAIFSLVGQATGADLGTSGFKSKRPPPIPPQKGFARAVATPMMKFEIQFQAGFPPIPNPLDKQVHADSTVLMQRISKIYTGTNPNYLRDRYPTKIFSDFHITAVCEGFCSGNDTATVIVHYRAWSRWGTYPPPKKGLVFQFFGGPNGEQPLFQKRFASFPCGQREVIDDTFTIAKHLFIPMTYVKVVVEESSVQLCKCPAELCKPPPGCRNNSCS
ncbi:hypothetical protein ACVII0_001928 [Sinorhizobium meliloti]